MKIKTNEYDNCLLSKKLTNFLVPETEEYTCGHCGERVIGGRYNNHCPHCLWSKHLDDERPGDRASKCQQLMKPVGVMQKKGKWRVIHQCSGCSKYTVVDSSPEDDFDLIIDLSRASLPDEYIKSQARSPKKQAS